MGGKGGLIEKVIFRDLKQVEKRPLPVDITVRARGTKLSVPACLRTGDRGESSWWISFVMLLNIKQNYFAVVCISLKLYLE